jgi:protein TonB
MIDVAIAPPIAGRGRGAGAAPVAGLALPASWPAAEGAYRVGGAIAPPVKRKDARPDYPKDAQEARVSGAVVMEVLIGPNGKVRDARVLRSVPLLDEAALKTVRKWEYTPTLVNGKAVPVVMTVTLTYRVN